MDLKRRDELDFLSSAGLTKRGSIEHSWLPWVSAGAAILLGLAALLYFTGRNHARPQQSGATLAAADPYAASLPISNLQMSEASNFAGGKVTYIDGLIVNIGSKTVTGATVQIAFRNDLGELSQKEVLAIQLIRTREPYVDTQPVGAAPLKPGDRREFRLILDHVTLDWNQQYPELRMIAIQTR